MTPAKPFRMLLAALALTAATATLAACSSAPSRESTGEFVDSSVITTKVKTALLNEPGLKSMQISVETFKDMVQLSGFVDSSAAKAKAGQLAASVEGVRSVKNDLVVK
ncbi:BON domain-containing protein [Ferrovibrio sp.]|uniref:BON domain-containing protein n=1 Tax=Ferrovibrio sp. TaxID=1917215 RepID=UPI0025C27931|nr:BON domain-containing protein [Ferrovibrio sp.]MBX3454443.1 BON domain-containing protein [Ferrovibrio sp.]